MTVGRQFPASDVSQPASFGIGTSIQAHKLSGMIPHKLQSEHHRQFIKYISSNAVYQRFFCYSIDVWRVVFCLIVLLIVLSYRQVLNFLCEWCFSQRLIVY